MKRRDSGELDTIVLPRDELAPPASAESIEAAVHAHLRKAEDDRPTLVLCPCCKAQGMVTPERAALFPTDTPEEEPCSRP